MKKLLMVTTVPDTLRAFFLPFANYFRTQGWQVDAMACKVSKDAECVEAFNYVWDVEWSRNPLNPSNLFSVPQKIRKIVAIEQYDLVHVFTPVAAFVTRYALKSINHQERPKIIYTALGFHFYQGGNPFRNKVFLTLEKLAGPWTDYLVVVNSEDLHAAKKYSLLPSENILNIPSGIGVNLDKFSFNYITEAEVIKAHQDLGIAEDNSLLLSVAEFIPRKHPQDILRAFAKLARPEVHLAFAGDGLLLKKMQLLAIDLGISKNVHFLGYRRDISILMRSSKAVILASEQEGLPISVIESLCMETPVIGTDIRGTRDLLQKKCGLLVKLEDIDGLSKAMAWILDNPEDAQIMGKIGRKQMQIYEKNHVINLHKNLYDKALESK